MSHRGNIIGLFVIILCFNGAKNSLHIMEHLVMDHNKYILSLMQDVLTSMFIHNYCNFLLPVNIILAPIHKCFWFMLV